MDAVRMIVIHWLVLGFFGEAITTLKLLFRLQLAKEHQRYVCIICNICTAVT